MVFQNTFDGGPPSTKASGEKQDRNLEEETRRRPHNKQRLGRQNVMALKQALMSLEAWLRIFNGKFVRF